MTLCAVSWGAAVAQAPIEVAALTFKDVATILNERCVLCHQGDAAPLGLRLDSFAGLMTGSERGPVVTPGEPDESEIIRRLEGSSLPRMPLTGPPFLDDAQIALVRQWIAAGAQEGVQASPEAPVTASDRPTDPGVTFGSVETIFLSRCAVCHTAQGAMGAPPEGLRLDSYENIIAGSDRVVVVPGVPLASELYRRVLGYSMPRMPFGGPFLSDAEIGQIEAWLAAGAQDAAGVAAPLPVGREVRLGGRLTALWALDGMPLEVTAGSRLDDSPGVGDIVEVRGVVTADGGIRVERVRGR